MPPTSDSPRILILRLGAIGDVVLNLPVLCALRDAFPHAHLAWVVESPAAPLLRNHPDLDELIELPRGWLSSLSTVRRTLARIRDGRYDTCLDLHGRTKAALLGWMSGIPRRIAFARSEYEGRELSTWFSHRLVRPTGEHVVERGLAILEPLGIARPAVSFRLPHDPEADAFADRFVTDHGPARGFAILNVGAGWPSKLWPTDRFAAVARHLADQHALPSVVLWAGPAERTAAESVVAAARPHASLAPSTSLLQLIALTRRARLFVSSDTGPLHIAAALGTPCVGLIGPMPVQRCRPYGPRCLAVQAVPVTGKIAGRKNADNHLMRAITVEQVAHACDTRLHATA